MGRQLNIRSDEAHQLAAKLAKRTGLTTTRVVEEALRTLDRATQPRDKLPELTPEQVQEHERFMALTRDARAYLKPGATSDHRDLYDEAGLPK